MTLTLFRYKIYMRNNLLAFDSLWMHVFTLKLIYVNLRRVMFGVETQSTNYSKREPRIYSTLTRKHTEVVSARVSILIMQKLRSIV